MQIFLFCFQYIFEYNQAGNKSMRCCIKCPLPWRVSRRKINLHKVVSRFFVFLFFVFKDSFVNFFFRFRVHLSNVSLVSCRLWDRACLLVHKNVSKNTTALRRPTLLTGDLKAGASSERQTNKQKKFISRSSSLKKKNKSLFTTSN